MIYVVTGAPRSGKSMFMQILRAGGVELTYDEEYLKASSFNENGFFEHDKPGDLLHDPNFRQRIDGKAINVVVHELFVIPFMARKNMKVISVYRPWESIFASMNRTLREGILGAGKSEYIWDWFVKEIGTLLKRLPRELKTFNDFMVADYNETIKFPRATIDEIRFFLGTDFDVDAACKVPEERLQHFREEKSDI